MFKTKICGITSVEDAKTVVQAGADALGLNFYARSPRCISRELAGEIVAAIARKTTTPITPHSSRGKAGEIVAVMARETVKVGLFVDTPAGEICQIFDELGLDLIQLHGDQPPEFLQQLGNRPVMRAFRIGPDGLQPVTEYLDRCSQLGQRPRFVMFDALVPGSFGGTGKAASWDVAREYGSTSGFPPLVLAGGLTSENVAEAILAVRPAAVDVASGVESRPGGMSPRKDPLAVAAFVQAARAAFTARGAG
jgi:phosphoribosylanthranilate isomerase